MTSAMRAEPGSSGGHRISQVDLVITTCEGREHLLRRTMHSLRTASDFKFRRTILALDGPVDPAAIADVGPDVVVQNWHRSGYVTSIINLVKQLDGDAFLWVEDDWSFPRKIDVERMRTALEEHPDWAQVRLSKSAPLSTAERARPLGDGFFESAWGFSANPSLNRTGHLKAVTEALHTAPRERRTGFETFFSDWFAARGVRCVVADPGDTAAVAHEGYLESTPRQFHMLASLDGEIGTHVPGIISNPSLLRRIAMLAKLLLRATSLGARLFTSEAAYETAFRIVTLHVPVDVAPGTDPDERH